MMDGTRKHAANGDFRRGTRPTSSRWDESVIVAETNKGLMQLVEINRALAHDLDLSRRMVAELSREKEDLLNENEILRIEQQQFQMTENVWPRKEERGAVGSGDGDRLQEELRKKLHLAERDTVAERARADMAEQQLRLLESEFESLVRERNSIRARLDESNLAMEEIRYRLASSMGENMLFYDSPI